MNLNHDASQELEALGHCQDHPNIVKVIEHVEDNKFRFVVFELLSGGELFSRIRERNFFSEDETRTYFRQLVDAVRFMHQNGIVHRDLKPENIMFDNKKGSIVKIVDFGFARLKTSEETQPCFTLDYAAPESLTKGTIKESRDWWALGAILYTMLIGHTPFMPQNLNKQNDEAKYRKKQMENIRQGDFNKVAPQWDKISPGAQDLISSLLRVNEADRFSLQDVLKNDWLYGNSKTELQNGTRFKEKPQILCNETITIDDDSLDGTKENREEVSSNDSSGIVLSDRNETSSLSSHIEEPTTTSATNEHQIEKEITPEDSAPEPYHQKKKFAAKSNIVKIEVSPLNHELTHERNSNHIEEIPMELKPSFSTSPETDEEQEVFRGFDDLSIIDIGPWTKDLLKIENFDEPEVFPMPQPEEVFPMPPPETELPRVKRRQVKKQLDEQTSYVPKPRMTRRRNEVPVNKETSEKNHSTKPLRLRKVKTEKKPNDIIQITVLEDKRVVPVRKRKIKAEGNERALLVVKQARIEEPATLQDQTGRYEMRTRASESLSKIPPVSNKTIKRKGQRKIKQERVGVTTVSYSREFNSFQSEQNAQPFIIEKYTYYRSNSPVLFFREYHQKCIENIHSL